MGLNPGNRIGQYQILAELGRGGMGEVYRARDTKLNRDVALKVLPAEFASDADRLARFTREAQTLASLNHPNIAQIFGIEERALVMELVEGEDLSVLIANGARSPGSKDPGLHLNDTLSIATQIADALEAAHEQGIVHRDLKPANIKVRDDGTVKVLDFGLAKAMGPDPADSGNSATLTSPAMTAMGMILGTAAYMSPEQAKGRVVDKRSDIWAFGVVLYEMLTGRRLFHGDSVAETIGFVATRDPDWTALPASTPSRVRRLLARCLTRDPKHRLRDIGEARIALATTEAGDSAVEGAPAPAATSDRRPLGGLIAGAATLIAIAAAGGWYWGSRGSDAPAASVAPFHAEIVPTPPDAFGRGATPRVFTFTPDGRALIYAANASADPKARLLYRRDRDSGVAVPIAGTEGAYGPFVSPDNAWIGFFADGKMKRVPAGGGAPQIVHDMRSITAPDALGFGWANETGPGREAGYGAAWLPDNTIVYGRFFGGLWRISVSGGPPTQLARTAGDGEIAHRLPQALPDGRTLLCTVLRNLLATPGSTIEAIDLATGQRTSLVDDATDGRYVPGGYLLFAREGALYSVRFDLASLKTIGEPVKLVDDVMHAVGGGSPGRASGTAQYDVSTDGTLAVLRGGVIAPPRWHLVWASRGGKTDPLPVTIAGYLGPRISPDGTRIAVTDGTALQIIGVRDGISTPLARDVIFPVWTPDSRSVLVGMRRENVRQEIYRVPLTGGAPEPVITGSNPLWPSSISRDGKFLAYVESHRATGNDIWVAGLTPKSEPVSVVATSANETHPMFSPDGRWLVYVVEEGGSSGIYVRPFPGPGRAERITREGGTAPVWTADGSIFYDSTQNLPGQVASTGRQITRVSIKTNGDRVSIGPSEVFAAGAFGSATPVSGFDVSADGARVLVAVTPPAPTGAAGQPSPAPTLQITMHANLAGAGRR